MTHSAKRAQRKLLLACLFALLFMCAEIVGGFLAGSLAIMTDAAHLLSDVAGFSISLVAIWLGTLPASVRHSFGFHRAEVIGAIMSVQVIWVLTGILLYSAVGRFMECLEPNPEERVDGKIMFIVACVGLVVNLILMKILGHGHSHGGGGGHGHSHGGSEKDGNHGHSHSGHNHADCSHTQEDSSDEADHCPSRVDSAHSHQSHGHEHSSDLENGHSHDERAINPTPKCEKAKKLENLNIEAAYIHALGDLIQSVGVCIAGGLIWYKPEWQIADPIATFFFSALVLSTTVGIIRDGIHVLMEGTPNGIHAIEIEDGLRACASVVAVHDLHIWSLSAGLPSLSVHLVSDEAETALHAAQSYLISMGITHITIQIEKTSTLYPRNCVSDLHCGQHSQGSD
ncbi:hypothetical protein BBJ28_00016683 [Nothophytophthora sp. Chile5]|nr:hypothetical protein BBJ28_00016683 [Nothophytophthora sp. Chile5]